MDPPKQDEKTSLNFLNELKDIISKMIVESEMDVLTYQVLNQMFASDYQALNKKKFTVMVSGVTC
jgi:hypothetical protein